MSLVGCFGPQALNDSATEYVNYTDSFNRLGQPNLANCMTNVMSNKTVTYLLVRKDACLGATAALPVPTLLDKEEMEKCNVTRCAGKGTYANYTVCGGPADGPVAIYNITAAATPTPAPKPALAPN